MSGTLEGLAACLIASLFFGSMFVPIRKHNTSDGLFVQWVMCAAIFLMGMLVNVYEDFPTFHPLAMLGGALWTIGNATAVPIISMLGMGMGMLIWGTTNCVVGWATSRFGLFGLDESVPNNIPLNYIGLVCVVIGGILFSRVKSRPRNAYSSLPNEDDTATRRLVDNEGYDEIAGNVLPPSTTLTERNKAVLGIGLSLVAGLFYGVTFVPVIYIQQHPDKFHDASPNGLSYVFATYCGIFVTSTLLLLIYVIVKKNKPFVNRSSILPAFATGTMWAVAQMSWFFANDRLSQAITFPIISMLPGVCAAAWSVFYFHEIEDRRSFQILSVAVLITIAGSTCVGLSKAL